ncbi:MAG: hypothetical protein J6K77_02595, partial [Ruminococcus sp.]|nr:hypothetical protein [Ruminococcus sp.]
CPKPCQRLCLWPLPKGHCPFGNPVFIGFADLGRCPNPCQRRCLWTLPKGHCPFGNPVFIGYADFALTTST